MKIPEFAKAIAGAVVAGVAPAAAAAGTPQGVTTSTGAASLIAAAVGFLATYFVPNASKAVKEGASGLVVTVKTDVGKFLSAFTAGLPGLVQSSAEAAITPAPAAPAVDAPVPPAA
jgi:hypothetical protein